MKRTVLVFAVLVGGSLPALGTKVCQADDEEAAVRKTVDSYTAAFNRGDAAALAEHWSEDGELTTPAGELFQGRKVVREGFEAFFQENLGAKLEVKIASIQVDPPDTAVEEGTARVTLPGQPASETSYVARYVKQEGQWKLKSIREVTKAPTHYEKLKELEWLIGPWNNPDTDSNVETVYQWTRNKNFLTQSFAISIADQVELEGTQVIGWDPAEEVIRSWLFDSDGGFGVGVWTREGDRWTIRALQVLPDGRKASAVNVLSRVDDSTFTWESTGREVGGEVLPNIGPVTVVRSQSDP